MTGAAALQRTTREEVTLKSSQALNNYYLASIHTSDKVLHEGTPFAATLFAT